MKIPRRALALLLLGAFGATFGASYAPAAGTPCRCTDHVCCGAAKSATVCPLRRAGLPCGMPAPAAPGLRAGCGCGHGAPPGAVAREEPALAPRVASLPAARLTSPERLQLTSLPLDLALAPEPPPPRVAPALV